MMGAQVHACFNQVLLPQTPLPSLHLLSFCNSITGRCGANKEKRVLGSLKASKLRRNKFYIASSSNVSAPLWQNWAPEKSSKAPSLSDILWPSAGAFAAMALLGKIDQILAPKGISMTIAPLGAVCAVLFATPASPGARKYNMFLAQIGCAAIGVLAFSIFGPGWLARSAALSAAIAFMIFTRSVHPPAASLPLLFIDGIKLHNLKFWYVLFPGAAGCILLCLIDDHGHMQVFNSFHDGKSASRDGVLLEGQLEILSGFGHCNLPSSESSLGIPRIHRSLTKKVKKMVVFWERK
ncbi:Integral membrane HPP family protein [Perilla frutescens var. hirtella]|uniref:Integral membrane HPP family protein n=1 Tax=Perilla frutescens var. hirtella TaxID=608512 RepID=A0AAD4IM48_PERFH|nr:Integral membrane HPP family protein [Perilla frutescens var. hirtella]